MSQIDHKLPKMLTLSALFGFLIMPMNATAGMVSPPGHNVVYKTAFNEVDGTESAVMDWKNPSVEFTFDMADADWTDALELFISADPLGRVSSRTPLMVQFNNGKPIPLVTRGQGFDSRIKLDKAKIRPRRNKIKFTYKTPSGAECLLPDHGGWRLNFKESFVVVKARAKSRNFDIREVEDKLGNATTAPRTISILARGQNTAKLQALAAQGVGMRMKTLPEFKTTKSNAEFEIILGRRDELYNWVTDKKILNSSGPSIFVHEGRPMRLVITGDTDAEVITTAGEFASRILPKTRRANTSLGEMQFQSSFKASQAVIDGTAKISELGGTYFEDGWGPKAKRIEFNVADPVASTGEILLRIASNKNVHNDSRVSVDLNGTSLGYTKLDKSRKTVAFDIPEGSLQGASNILTITPDLKIAKASGCDFNEKLPGFSLGDGSKIKINTPFASPVAELSKMTATGAPFSVDQGKDTLIVLPASSSRDYAASLKILAKLAKTSGGGWSEANYMRSTNYAALAPEKNILFIGPSSSFRGKIRNNAPKGLTSALKGKVITGTGQVIASDDRFASNNELDTMRLYAARQAKAGRIRQGGVAALYPSPLAEGKVMGVITNVPGGSFANAASHIVKPSHWNSLEGSVARWNKSSVLMAQTAIAVPGFAIPKPTESGFSDMTSGFSLPEFKMPEFEMPSLDMSFFSMDGFDADLAKSRMEDFRTRVMTMIGRGKIDEAIPKIPSPIPKPQKTEAYAARASNSSYVSTQASMVQISVPNLRRSIINNTPEIKLELRGFSEIRPKSQGVKSMVGEAKSWIAVKSDKIKKMWQNRNDTSTAQRSKIKSPKILAGSTDKEEASVSASQNILSMTGAQLGERIMNMPALLLILILGGLFALIGLVTPNTARREKH